MVKRLRHRPFTAVSGVRFPLGSPKNPYTKVYGFFTYSLLPLHYSLKIYMYGFFGREKVIVKREGVFSSI